MKDAPAGFGLWTPASSCSCRWGWPNRSLGQHGYSRGYFPLQFGGNSDRRSLQRYVWPKLQPQRPRSRFVDLDGDGVTDVIRSGTRLECFFNDPVKGWHETRRGCERKGAQWKNSPTSTSPTLVSNGVICLATVYKTSSSCTTGAWSTGPTSVMVDWGKRISYAVIAPVFPFGYNPQRILIGDVDGDGVADLVYVDDRKILTSGSIKVATPGVRKYLSTVHRRYLIWMPCA